MGHGILTCNGNKHANNNTGDTSGCVQRFLSLDMSRDS